MQLKRVFQTDGAGQQEIYDTLNKARSFLKTDLERKRTKLNSDSIQSFEKKLTNIFYPEKATEFSQEYSKIAAQKSAEEIGEIIKNYNFFTKSGQYKNKARIKEINFENLVMDAAAISTALNQQLLTITDSDTYQSLSQMLRNIEVTLSRAYKVLNEFYSGKNRTEFFIKKVTFSGAAGKTAQYGTDVIEVANILNNFIKSVTGLKSPQEAGVQFEEFLTRINFKDKAEGIVEELMYMLMDDGKIKQANTNVRSGDSSVSRGYSGGNITVSYQINEKVDYKKGSSNGGKDDSHGFTVTDKNVTYSYNPNASKMGKMDVYIKYGNDSTQWKNYRSSLKRWSHGIGDLGETSIDAAISRSSQSVSVVEAYKFAVLTPKFDAFRHNTLPKFSAAEIAHEFAKLALTTDIAMGLNQRKGYANLLIIDTGISIRVIDLTEIIQKINNKQENSLKCHLTGYDSENIKNSAIANYTNMSKINNMRTSSYLGLMTSTLNSMKVSIRMSALN